MATSLVIEQDGGTFTGRHHRHNGYYAGNFYTRPTTGQSYETGPVTALTPAQQVRTNSAAATPQAA